MAIQKVHTSGPVLPVPISEFKPSELAAKVTGNTEAIITRNKDTLGVYMSVEHRNELAHQAEVALYALEMLSDGYTWEDLKRSSDQAAAGQSVSMAELRRRSREAGDATPPH